MSLKTEDSKTKVAQPDNDTTAVVQKDSTPDSTSTDTAESNETAVPPPFTARAVVAPTPNRTTSLRSLKPATQATPTTNDDARRLNINNVTFRFDTIDDALGDGLMGREPLNIEIDDVAVVKNLTNSKAWVKQLIEAFGQDYLAESEDRSKSTPKQKDWFARWQKQAHTSVVAIFEAKDPAHLEKSCWHLFDAVIKAHELGVVNAANHLAASDLKCSERLSLIVSIIEKYALVRLDVLRSWHVDEIAANPEAFIKRKITNCWNNGHRAERLAEKTADEKASGKGSGRKRKARNEEGEPEEKSDVQTPVETKKARESGSDDDNDAEEDGQSNGKSSTERSHTARIPDSDLEKSTTSERPTTSKGQPDDEVETPVSKGSTMDMRSEGEVAAPLEWSHAS